MQNTGSFRRTRLRKKEDTSGLSHFVFVSTSAQTYVFRVNTCLAPEFCGHERRYRRSESENKKAELRKPEAFSEQLTQVRRCLLLQGVGGWELSYLTLEEMLPVPGHE